MSSILMYLMMSHCSVGARNYDVYNLFESVDSEMNRSKINRELCFRSKCLESQKDKFNSCIDHDFMYNNRKIHQHQKEGVYLLQIHFAAGNKKLHSYCISSLSKPILRKERKDL